MLEGGLIGLLAVAIVIVLSNAGVNEKAAKVRLLSYIVAFVTLGVLIGGAISGQLF